MAQTRPPGRDPSRLRTPALFFPNSGPALITSRVSVFFFCFSLIFTTHLLPLMRNLTQTITNIPPPSKIRNSYHWDRNKRGRERGNKRHRETKEEQRVRHSTKRDQQSASSLRRSRHRVWFSNVDDDGISGNLDNRYLRNQNLRFLLQLCPTSRLVRLSFFSLAPHRIRFHRSGKRATII